MRQMRQENRASLRTRAVDCDALARGEQVFLLRAEPEVLRPEHRREEFWLLPSWEEHRARDLTGPYRDRMRSLDDLRRPDGRLRLKHYAEVEYFDAVDRPERLLRLDGEHTLNSRAVERLFERGVEGRVALLVLRVHALPEAAVMDVPSESDGPGPWRRLASAAPTASLEPVIGDDVFLTEKARVLRKAGSLEAV